MSVNGQSDNQSEASFNISGSVSEAPFNFIGNSESSTKIEDDTNGVIGNSEVLIKIEDHGDKPGDNSMVVDGAASGSDGNTVVSAVATPQSGSAAGDGVSSAPTLHAGLVDAPTPPPGNWGILYDSAPQWFSPALHAAVQAAVTHSMHNVVIPHIEQTFCTALKRVAKSHHRTGMVVVVLLLGMRIRRTTLVVHGIHHQRFYPAVRHGKVPLAQGVMATSLTLRPTNGDLHGPRVWNSPVFGKHRHRIGTIPLVHICTPRGKKQSGIKRASQIMMNPRSVWSSPSSRAYCMTR